MEFDEERYLREVLEPARAAGNQPPDDVRIRYQLTEPLTARDVESQVKQVRMCWRKARGQLRFRRLIDRLEGDHRRYAPLFERAAAGDLSPLRTEIKGTSARTEHRRSELAARLLDAAGEIRMLSPRDISGIVKTPIVSNDSVPLKGDGGDEAHGIAVSAGIEIREPDQLPAGPPYAGYPRAREALDALGHRHLLEFLYGTTQIMRVFGPAPHNIRPAIARAGADWARRPHDGNKTNAETVLVTLKQADDLAALIRWDIIARLRERHRQRASERALLQFATTELSVDGQDARRLIFAIRGEGAPAGGLAPRLRELIDSGSVHAAAELAATATEDELAGDARMLADEARRRVNTATVLREEAVALATTDPDAAWLRMADALALVADLPGATEVQSGLAPLPVPHLNAAVDGATVSLSWPPSLSRVGEIAYRLVRRVGRPPRHAADGDPIADPVDAGPPINTPIYYAVIAFRDRGVAAATVTGPVYVRPEPAGVTLSAGDGEVAGRWRTPAEAARILLTRDGIPVAAERGGFRDHSVRNGTTYRYRVAAIYIDELGQEKSTAGVHAAATPAAKPDPVPGFEVEHDPSGRLIVTFDEPAHGEVEMIALTGPPSIPYGTTVPLARARRLGRVLSLTPAPHGVMIRASPGVLLAVSVSGDVATIGAHREHVNLAAPGELIAQRHGSMIFLGFDWPPGVSEVEVTWRAGRQVPERLRAGRAGYDAQGGLRLPAPRDEDVEIEVAAAATVNGRSVTGVPATTNVPGRATVAYELRRSRLGGTLGITLTAEREVNLGHLVLVARSDVLPQHSDDGRTLAGWNGLTVTPGTPLRLDAPRPPRSRRTWWLRCFADDVELRDPPVRLLQMR
jgi:hypothetical protein